MSLTKLIRTAIVGAGISLSSYYALNCGGEETTNNYYGGSEEGKQNSYVDENGNYSCESGVRMTQELCLDLVDETMKRQIRIAVWGPKAEEAEPINILPSGPRPANIKKYKLVTRLLNSSFTSLWTVACMVANCRFIPSPEKNNIPAAR